MKFLQILISVSVLGFVISCGDKSSSTDPVKPPPGKVSLNINDVWKVTAKRCGSTTIGPKPMEAYKFDESHFIKINQLSDDALTLCKIGYVYDRIISSFESREGIYEENSTLRSSGAKKSCWKKQGGSPVEPSTSEVIEFGPELLQLKLGATPTTITVDLRNSSECPGETLRLELSK